MARYAVFGGTFDPIHNGHLALAEAVLTQLELDDVLLVPSAQNPLKGKSGAGGRDRMAMCQAATFGHPKVFTSDIELSRGGRSYTVETLEEITLARPGKVWFVMGTDSLGSFEKWKNPLRIVALARLAVIERPDVNTGAVMARLPLEVQDAIDLIKAPLNRASSTEIRHLVREGLDPSMWLHPKVWEYIQEHGLYKA